MTNLCLPITFSTPGTQIFLMSLLVPAASFVSGFILGVGAMILYLQYSMYSQMSDLQEHMGEMQDLTSGDFDMPVEDVEDIQGENKKEKEE